MSQTIIRRLKDLTAGANGEFVADAAAAEFARTFVMEMVSLGRGWTKSVQVGTTVSGGIEFLWCSNKHSLANPKLSISTGQAQVWNVEAADFRGTLKGDDWDGLRTLISTRVMSVS